MNDPQSEPNDESKPKPLSASEAAEFAGRIAELSNAGLPLAPGLRAAAAELPNSRLAAALERVAAALDRGQSLEQALAAERGALPRHVQALVTAGVRTGKLGQVLEEVLEFRQVMGDLRRSVWVILAYPLLLIVLLSGVLLFFAVVVIPAFQKMFHDFKQELPLVTKVVLQVASVRFIATVGALALITFVLVAGLAVVIGRQRRRWVVNHVPLFGALWRFSGLAEMAYLLRILLAHEVRLPEALRLTADATGDADLGSGCHQLAARVESGARLADAIDGLPQFGSTLRPMLAWGESHSALPAAMDTAAQFATRRVQLRAEWVKAIISPAVFIGVVATLYLFILALFMPLASLIWYMTGGHVITTLSSGSATRGSAAAATASTLVSSHLDAIVSVMLLVICIAVLIVLWIIHLRRTLPADEFQAVMRSAAWSLVGLCLLGVLFYFIGIPLTIVLLTPFVCWGMALFRFRQAQRLTLLNLLALSADRGILLAPAVRALGEEEGGWFFSRANSLADCLIAGMPTAKAIDQNRQALPPSSALAARIGEATGALGAALRSVDDRRNHPERNAPPFRLARLVYILVVGGTIVPYWLINLAPAMQKIFHDFHRKLPPLTAAIIRVGSSPLTIALCVLSLTIIAVLLIYGILRKLGWVGFDLPPLGRILAPFDAAVVLRWLALVAERGQPLEATLGLAAARYPRQLIRKRLRSAGADIFCGRHWIDSLRSAKLVQKADAAILHAAARVGNLPWALTEAAANGERRLNYRLSAIGQIVFPLLVLVVGAVVMVLVVGWFMPLIDLIGSMAGKA